MLILVSTPMGHSVNCYPLRRFAQTPREWDPIQLYGDIKAEGRFTGQIRPPYYVKS